MERKLVLSGTTFISISTGIVMNFSTSSALLPGHWVMTTTRVLITSGNASIGVFAKLKYPQAARIAVAAKTVTLFFKQKDINPLNNLFMITWRY
jgi:hypothetical protein